MRSQIQDNNAGAAMDVAPTKMHATRTATIAKHNNNSALLTQKNINTASSVLGEALGRFMDDKRATELEQRYQQAYHDQGTQAGLDEYKKDLKRTGFTEFIYGGQSPEYAGALDASARNASNAVFLEESQFIEGAGGDLTPEQYQQRIQDKITEYNKENFSDAPDAAFAFMKNWRENSNALSKQQFKLYQVREQEKARQTVAQGWQTDLDMYKTVISSDPTRAKQIGIDMFSGKNIPNGMSKQAARDVVIESAFSAIQSGDYAALKLFNNAGIKLDAKQHNTFDKLRGGIDTDNTNYLSAAKSDLQAAYNDPMATVASVEAARVQYNNVRKQILARDTGSSEYIKYSAGSDIANIAGYNAFKGRVKSESTAYEGAALDALKLDEARYKVALEGARGVQGSLAERSDIIMENIVKLADITNNPNVSVKLRTYTATKWQEALSTLTKEEKALLEEDESFISSNANMIASQFNLEMTQTDAPEEILAIKYKYNQLASELYSKTTDPNTLTLLNNLMTSTNKSTSNTLDTMRNEVIEAQLNALTISDAQLKQDMFDARQIHNAGSLEADEAAKQVLATRIEELTKQKEHLGSNASPKLINAIDNQIKWINTESERYRTTAQIEADRLAEIQRKATERETSITSNVNAIMNGKSLTGKADEQAAAMDSVFLSGITTPENKDKTNAQRAEAAFSTVIGANRVLTQIDKYGSSIKLSPVFKSALDAAYRSVLKVDPTQDQEWTSEQLQQVQAVSRLLQNSNVANLMTGQQRAEMMFMQHAVSVGMDRSTAIDIMLKTDKDGYDSPSAKEGWFGVTSKLGLDRVSENIQADAEGMYKFLLPKVGHQQALVHTHTLIKQASIITNSIDIAGGQTYPTIKYSTTGMSGKELQGEKSLEDISKDLERVTITPIVDDVLGTTEYVSSSPANLLVQKLIGNAVTKDGATVKSLKEIPGKVQAEVRGDSIIFYSAYGTAVLTPAELSGVAASQVRGQERNEHYRNTTVLGRASSGNGYRAGQIRRANIINEHKAYSNE